MAKQLVGALLLEYTHSCLPQKDVLKEGIQNTIIIPMETCFSIFHLFLVKNPQTRSPFLNPVD